MPTGFSLATKCSSRYNDKSTVPVAALLLALETGVTLFPMVLSEDLMVDLLATKMILFH